MKRIITLILAIVMLASLFSCSGYKNSYTATKLSKSTWGNDCDVEFATLKGTLVLNTRVGVDNYGMIHYDAELVEGEMSVYCDVNNSGKQLLFTIRGGERVDARGGQVKTRDKVVIIIETVGVAKRGDIEIDFD